MQINAEIPIPFSPLVDKSVRKVVEKSGRSAGKSTTNEVVAIAKMLQSRANNIWYCRAEKSDLRLSVFNSFISTIQMLGLEKMFKTSVSPMEITCLKTGAKCYFSGINGKVQADLTATKGFTPQNKTLAMFILDEANEARYSTHVKAAETTANKFLLPDSKIVYAYNPPPVRNHWANTYFNSMINDGASLIYTTWEDIRDLLKQTTIDEIEKERENDPVHYAYWYLGQQVSLEGLVLYTFKRERNLVSWQEYLRKAMNGYQPVYMIYGVDSGVVKDATAVSAWGVMPDGKLLKFATFYWKPKEHGNEPTPNSEQVNLIKQWYDQMKSKYLSYGVILPTPYNEIWVFDSAVVTTDLRLEWERKTMFHCQSVEKKNIEKDIKRLQNGYYNGFLQILDIPENKASLDEIESFSYDEENNIPEGQDDHTIDADKYATSFYYYQYLLG